MGTFAKWLVAMERGESEPVAEKKSSGGKGRRPPWRGVHGKPVAHFMGKCRMPDGELIDPQELRAVMLALNPHWDFKVDVIKSWMNWGSRFNGGTASHPNVRISQEHVVHLLHAIGRHSREQVAEVIRVLRVPKACPKTIGSGPAVSDEELAVRIEAVKARIATAHPIAAILEEIADPIDEEGGSNDGDD